MVFDASCPVFLEVTRTGSIEAHETHSQNRRKNFRSLSTQDCLEYLSEGLCPHKKTSGFTQTNPITTEISTEKTIQRSFFVATGELSAGNRRITEKSRNSQPEAIPTAFGIGLRLRRGDESANTITTAKMWLDGVPQEEARRLAVSQTLRREPRENGIIRVVFDCLLRGETPPVSRGIS